MMLCSPSLRCEPSRSGPFPGGWGRFPSLPSCGGEQREGFIPMTTVYTEQNFQHFFYMAIPQKIDSVTSINTVKCHDESSMMRITTWKVSCFFFCHLSSTTNTNVTKKLILFYVILFFICFSFLLFVFVELLFVLCKMLDPKIYSEINKLSIYLSMYLWVFTSQHASQHNSRNIKPHGF